MAIRSTEYENLVARGILKAAVKSADKPLHRVRPAPGGHEGHPQPQDQAARVVPAVRALDPARGDSGG